MARPPDARRHAKEHHPDRNQQPPVSRFEPFRIAAVSEEQPLQRDPTVVQLVAPRLDNRENRAREHGQERQPHQHKSRRRYVLPVLRAPEHQGSEYAEKHEEQTVAPKNLLRRKSQNARQVKAKKREDIPGPERRRRKHARHGRAQESKDKSANNP